MEGAIALAKFGQFERALNEFKKLIDTESHRVVAAKNILRCQIQRISENAAADQYEAWAQKGDFPTGQLEKIRLFLVEILKSMFMKPLTLIFVKRRLRQCPRTLRPRRRTNSER